MGSIGRGRARSDTNPYDNRTKTPLRLFSQRRVGEEADWVNGRPIDLPGFNHVTYLGSDSVPDTVEWRVEDSAERLDRDVSTDRPGKGRSEAVRAVDEVWVATITSDAVIIRHYLILVGAVQGDSGHVA